MKTSLHEITLEEFSLYCISYEILPGQKLCFCCKNSICWVKKENENVDTEHENENKVIEIDGISHEIANYNVNQSLQILECSSLKVLQSDIEHYQLVKGRSRMLQQSFKMLYP